MHYGHVFDKRPPSLSDVATENEIGFTEHSVPYEDVFLNAPGGPGDHAPNASTKSRLLVGVSIVCLLGTFMVTIIAGSFFINSTVGLMTTLLIGNP